MLLQQEHTIVVVRSCNHASIVKGFGKTPQEAAAKVLGMAREYGYWDAIKAYPQNQKPETGKERGEPRGDR